MRKEIDTHLTPSATPFLAHKPFQKSGQKRHTDGNERGNGKFTKHNMEDDVAKNKRKSHKKRKHDA